VLSISVGVVALIMVVFSVTLLFGMRVLKIYVMEQYIIYFEV